MQALTSAFPTSDLVEKTDGLVNRYEVDLSEENLTKRLHRLGLVYRVDTVAPMGFYLTSWPGRDGIPDFMNTPTWVVLLFTVYDL